MCSYSKLIYISKLIKHDSILKLSLALHLYNQLIYATLSACNLRNQFMFLEVIDSCCNPRHLIVLFSSYRSVLCESVTSTKIAEGTDNYVKLYVKSFVFIEY